jgi:hypothetical protein
MVEDSKGGKLLVRDVPSIGGGEAQMTIPAAEVCAAAGRNSETMRRDVDEEVLVPLLRATAKEVMGEFKACLKDALVGGTIGSIVCVDGGPEKAVEILKGYPDWECWYTIAPVKGASRIKEKVGEYAKSHWPGVEQLGDCLRAMVVCRRGKKSGDLIYRTWKQLEQAFDIRKGHGRLKNNYATAGILEGPKHQKPPDMLMNAVLDVEGCMSMPAEIQVHHEEILELKESKVHLLYEIARAKSIDILRGTAPARKEPKKEAQLPERDAVKSEDTIEVLNMELDLPKEENTRLAATTTTSTSTTNENFAEEILPYPFSLYKASSGSASVLALPQAQTVSARAGERADNNAGGREEDETTVQLREEIKHLKAVNASLSAAAQKQQQGLAGLLPPIPSISSSLTESQAAQAKKLFRMALAQQRSGWGVAEVPTEIGRETFTALIKQLLTSTTVDGASEAPTVPSSEELNEIFDSTDSDGDRKVSEQEFLDLYAQIQLGDGDGIGGRLLKGASAFFGSNAFVFGNFQGGV